MASNLEDSREGRRASTSGEMHSGIGSWPKQTKQFLGDVRAETKRVTWPNAQQVRATTIVVLVTVFSFGAYFGILDWMYTQAVQWLLRL